MLFPTLAVLVSYLRKLRKLWFSLKAKRVMVIFLKIEPSLTASRPCWTSESLVWKKKKKKNLLSDVRWKSYFLLRPISFSGTESWISRFKNIPKVIAGQTLQFCLWTIALLCGDNASVCDLPSWNHICPGPQTGMELASACAPCCWES